MNEPLNINELKFFGDGENEEIVCNNQLEAMSSLLINLINLTLTEFEQEMEGK